MLFENMSNRSIIRRYVLPQMLGLVCNSVYFIVDGIFVGNRLGAAALAAVGIAVPVVELLIALSMMIASGGGILVSAAKGRGDAAQARRVFNFTALCTLAVSLTVAVGGALFTRPLSLLLGATPTALGMTVDYLRTFLVFSPFLVFSFVLSTFARNDGRPGLAMFALMLGSAMNILLDWVFMYPLDMGIYGAALATGLGPVCSVLLLLPHFLRRRGALHFQRPRREPGQLRLLLQNGLPAFISEFSIGMVTLLYNLAIVRAGLGDDGLAAYLVVGYAALLCLTAFIGAGEGIQPIASYLHGAGQHRRIRSLRRTTMLFLGAVAVGLYLLLLTMGRGFYGLFVSGDTALLDFIGGISAVYFLCLPPAACNLLHTSYLQCTGLPMRALVLSLARSVGFTLLFLLALPRIWTQNGLWWAMLLAELATVILALLLGRGPAAVKHTAAVARPH